MTVGLLVGAAMTFGNIAAAQEPQFTEFMQPQGQSSFQYYLAVADISDDGQVAVGSRLYSERPLVWVGGGHATQLGFEPYPPKWAAAYGVSPDGSVIVGGVTDSWPQQAIVWRDRVVEFLPNPEDVTKPFGEAQDVSANGVIVGTVNRNVGGAVRRQAVRWVEGVMEPLPDPPGSPQSTEGLFVSNDGSIIVGRARMGAGYRAVRWVGDAVQLLEGLVPDGTFDPHRMSSDGSVIVGSAANGTGSEAVRWVDGAIEGLGFLPGGVRSSVAKAVRDDGNLIIGYSVIDPVPTCIPSYHCGGSSEGFVWTPETGMLPLEEWLRYGCGFDVVNWHIGAHVMSADGSTLYVSTSQNYGTVDHWVVDVRACTTDYEVPAWETKPGDYYVTDYHTSSIHRMHRETGELEQLTSFQEIYLPIDLAMGPRGEIYVLSSIWDRIVRFDPETGEQSIVSKHGIIYDPRRIVVGVDGTLYVINTATHYTESDGIVRVDPDTGEQSMLAIGGWIQPRGDLALGPNGNLLTLSSVDGDLKIIEVDVENGEQSVVTTVALPTGAVMARISYDPHTDRLRAMDNDGNVLAVDLESGAVSVFPSGKARYDHETGSNGDALMASWGEFYRLSPDTLETTLLASSGHLEGANQIVEILSRCSDRLDNDGDGLVDADDPACVSPHNDSEQYRMDVRIDILPGDPDNRIALHEPRPISVLVFGSDDFDVRAIDVEGVGFGPAGARTVLDFENWLVRLLSYRDWNGDGVRDLSLTFALEETEIGFEDTEACLEGHADEVPFRACDDIQIETAPSCGRGSEIALVIPAVIGLRRIRRRRRSSKASP